MALTFGFSGSIPFNRLCKKQTAKPAIGSFGTITKCRFGRGRVGLTLQNGILEKRSVEESEVHKIRPVMAFGRGIWSDPSPLSASDAIKEFYVCINEGELKQLRDFISADCYMDECSFLVPFRGKKEVLRFFEQLIEGLGDNIKFKVNKVCEGDGLTVAANWHLEWKNTEIPFTRGCSFYECRKEGDQIRIMKAQIMIESPVKPGGLALQLLKIVTKVFDNFPNAAGWFLKRYQIILKLFLRIYSVFLFFISPFLKSYSQVWNFTTGLQAHGFNTFLYVIKFFMK